MTVQEAADLIREETDKFDAPISQAAAYAIARQLHQLWCQPAADIDINVAQTCRRRYEGDDWEAE